jgi:integrase
MNANFKLILRTDHKDKQQRSLIFLRVTSNYKVKYFSTARKIQDRFWNKDREQVRSSHPDSVELNQYLEDFLKTARERFRQTGFNINAVERNTVVPDVVSFIDQLVKDHNKLEQFRTRQKYITLKNKLVEFTGTNRIPFEKVNKNLIQEFDSFLQLSHYNRVNTRIKYLEMLRRTVNLAVEEEILTTNPFPKLKMRKERSEKRRLNIAELKRLREYDAPVNTNRYHAKNMFLLSFYIGGSRFEDTVLLEWSHIKNGSLYFTMGKTGKQYQIALLPEAREIIDRYAHRADEFKYIFPLMPENVTKEDIARFKQTVNAKNSLINNKLAVIAKHLGIEKFTFHCARHSIADYLRLKKVDLYTVSKILRHSNLKTTEIYLKQFDTDSVSKEFAKAFEEETT